jgi:hypothetical protein
VSCASWRIPRRNRRRGGLNELFVPKPNAAVGVNSKTS